MAKLSVAVSDWMQSNALDASAIQCWTSVQENYGINACTLMSMMSEKLMPSACEVDVTGALSMYALQLASGRPSAIIANTVKGKGVPFMEDVAKWHHGVPNDEEYERAIRILDEAEANM